MSQANSPRLRLSPGELEEATDTLKERIYSTLALLAVVVSIGPSTSTGAAMFEIAGTALSLWAAALIAAQMAHRLIHGSMVPARRLAHLLRVHASILASAVPTLVLIGAAWIGWISLETALNASEGLAVLTLFAWSLASARAMRAPGLVTLGVAALDALLGLAIVGLKFMSAH